MKKELIGPFKQLLPMSGLPIKGALKDEQLQVINDAGILTEEGKVVEVGAYSAMIKKASAEGTRIEMLEGTQIALPGFVDAHTHICWGGSREKDYALRVCGTPYLEIAKQGGGILDTVRKTREASASALLVNIQKRLKAHLKRGITTVEIKSGYGLNLEDELKILRTIKEAKESCSQHLVSTCLAAHMKAADFNGSNADYLDFVVEKILPTIQAEQLSKRVDIFVEESAFSATEAETFLTKASAMGFDLTVHADQFTSGGSNVAVRHNALSADHLESSTEEDIKALATSNVTAVALPGASIGLGMRFTPARKLLDAGASLAIASDWNPGSAPMGDLLTQASILGTFQKLSTAETLAAVTIRAAKALKLENKVGSLEKGKSADFISFECEDYRDILYNQGQLQPQNCWIKAKLQNA